ncbi:hypothetical protein T4B_10385 [Trichinella pseudospiralis]|uniref:Uncharacterized protein n=1 Tax=Trichinella pseudospiralis TaxID=6337 RepID=A0A0V1KA78_TRIPS|nr:hypothetical protein T4B_10385 [Trichinella pseudospiralis]KRZ44071.1 hypothetical protein T4C_11694 [Trichinella pseudospiralis]
MELVFIAKTLDCIYTVIVIQLHIKIPLSTLILEELCSRQSFPIRCKMWMLCFLTWNSCDKVIEEKGL